MAIRYYSTNRKLKTGDIQGFGKSVSLADALFTGQAPDKGLFMPTRIPRITRKEIMALKGKPYHRVACTILGKFISSDLSARALQRITKGAYDFDVPIEQLDDTTHLVRLDRGPTASFKDFAARLMARLMELLRPANKQITILVATSGDTGSAIGEAYRGLKGFRVFVLYPKSEVTSIQKKQLNRIGKNVQAIAVSGKFDDCQKLVKQAFTDPELASLNLTSANSINIGRILPQIVYYFYSYANTARNFEPVVFCVPSGNFGNSLGCEIARRMGLPVKRLIVATNENDEFPRFLESGSYRKVEPAKACLSNAMNVGNPSNLARYFDLYGGTLDKDGVVHKRPRLSEMRGNLFSTPVTDKETVKTIKKIYNESGVVLEPHGAVGITALERYFSTHQQMLAISIETAAPYKFPEVVKKELKITPPIPPALKVLDRRKGKADYLRNSYSEFRKYLLRKASRS